jgi:hypothetical protein
LRGFVMPHAFQMAQDQGQAVSFRKPAYLFIDHRPQFGLVVFVPTSGYLPGYLAFNDSSPRRLNLCLPGNPVRDSVQPVRQALAVAKGPRLFHQDEEGGLERIFRRVGILQDATADSENHRSVPNNQGSKRGLSPVSFGQE